MYIIIYTYIHTLHYITLHYITLHYITLHYITLHYITLHYITLHYITLHYITLHYITLHYITLHYITLHYITLHYITLQYTHTYILYHPHVPVPICIQGACHVKQIVDKGEVVKVDVRGEVWPSGPHEEIHIGQVAEKPAAHQKRTHGTHRAPPNTALAVANHNWLK